MQPIVPLRKLQGGVGRINRAYSRGVGPEQLREQATRELQDFLEKDWGSWQTYWDRELDKLEKGGEEIEPEVVQNTIQEFRQHLEPITHQTVEQKEELQQARQMLTRASGEAGAQLYGMGLAGRSQEALEVAGRCMEELLQNVAFQVELRRVAHQAGHPPQQLAPAALAAAICRQPGMEELTIREALDEFGLAADAGQTEFEELEEMGKILYASVQKGREQATGLTRVRESLSQRARNAGRKASNPRELDNEQDEQNQKDLSVPALLGLEAQYMGSVTANTVLEIEYIQEQAGRQLFNHHLATRQALWTEQQNEEGPTTQSPQGARLVSLIGLQQLDDILATGHKRWQKLERKWKQDVERQMGIQKVNVFPLQASEEITSLEAMEMYFQEAMKKGMPAGLALAQLYDSDLTFGQREAQRLEAIIFRGAYQFTIDYASERNWSLLEQTVGDNRRRIEEAQAVLRDIEVDLRNTPDSSEEELMTRAREGLRQAIRQGLLPDGAGRQLTPILEEMIDRIRAHDEIRHLLHLHVLVGRAEFQELLQNYRDLPYTQRFALGQAGQDFQEQNARNGQTMEELGNSVRRTWKQERAGVRSGQDHLIEEEEEERSFQPDWKRDSKGGYNKKGSSRSARGRS